MGRADALLGAPPTLPRQNGPVRLVLGPVPGPAAGCEGDRPAAPLDAASRVCEIEPAARAAGLPGGELLVVAPRHRGEVVAGDRGQQVTVVWATGHGVYAVPTVLLDVEPAPGARWRLGVAGSTARVERRSAPRTSLAVPVSVATVTTHAGDRPDRRAARPASVHVDVPVEVGLPDTGLPDSGLPDSGLHDSGLHDEHVVVVGRTNDLSVSGVNCRLPGPRLAVGTVVTARFRVGAVVLTAAAVVVRTRAAGRSSSAGGVARRRPADAPPFWDTALRFDQRLTDVGQVSRAVAVARARARRLVAGDEPSAEASAAHHP